MVTTLILFLLINGYFIISFALFRMGLKCSWGAVEISPRALVVKIRTATNTLEG